VPSKGFYGGNIRKVCRRPRIHHSFLITAWIPQKVKAFSRQMQELTGEKAASMPIQNAQHFGHFSLDAIHGVLPHLPMLVNISDRRPVISERLPRCVLKEKAPEKVTRAGV
jgi:hypothetical protein